MLDEVFGGNELVYSLVQLGTGISMSVSVGKIMASNAAKLAMIKHHGPPPSTCVKQKLKPVSEAEIKATWDGAINSSNKITQSKQLINGSRMKTNQALEAAEQFLGKGYKDLGKGRFISKDGYRQVRMGDADILGKHAGGPHMNFEKLIPNVKKPGKMIPNPKDNIHIFLED